MFFTWTALGSCQYEPSDLHSAVAEPAPSLRGTHSYEPAQKVENKQSATFHSPDTCALCVCSVCVCVFVSVDSGEMAYTSLPLSPDQRSSSPVGVFVDSSFLQPLSSSSDLAQCAGMVLKHPVTDNV